MKKIFIFWFLNFLACCPAIHAQTAKSDLCSFLRKIESNAATNFRAINKGMIDSVNDHFSSTVYMSDQQFSSTHLILAGSRHCYIEKTDSTSIYNAVIPITQDEEAAARKKTEELKNKIVNCLSNYTIKSYLKRLTPAYQNITSEDIVAKYEFRKKNPAAGKSPAFVLWLTDFRGFGGDDYHDYTMYLSANGTDIRKTINKNVSPVGVKNKNEKKELTFTQQLLELLDYSKDGFKAVKGNVNKELTEKYKITGNTYYKTSYSLEGAIEKYIEVFASPHRPTIFKAYFGKDLTMSGGDDLFNKLYKELKPGFANGFVIKKDFQNYEGDLYTTVRVQRDNDDSHYIELTLLYADNMLETTIEVYITIK